MAFFSEPGIDELYSGTAIISAAAPSTRRWNGSHRVEPPPDVGLLLVIPAEHAVSAIGDVAVLLFDVVAHDEEAFESHPVLHLAHGRAARSPGRRRQRLRSLPFPRQRMELPMVL